VAMQLPAGLADLSVVPRLLRPDDKHDEVVGQAGRVYVASIYVHGTLYPCSGLHGRECDPK
jgi:hypothetical protein